MSELFYRHPIINSPYEYPGKHWKLEDRIPVKVEPGRRRCDFLTPVPPPRRRRKDDDQRRMVLSEEEYNKATINELRSLVTDWRNSRPENWHVAPATRRLLEHWRHHHFGEYRPFFCQIEAVETAIWLTEVAPLRDAWKKRFWTYIENGNSQANPELLRLALKLATGAGKTTVMAMLIAWHTLNAVRHPNSKKFSRGFLIVTPGITIKDRLRVLQPNDPENYYRFRELVPSDMLLEMESANIVITNYHALRPRETRKIPKNTKVILGIGGASSSQTLESEGEMLRRVMPELMGMRNIIVLNDEAHHCYREKIKEDNADGVRERKLREDERQEAKSNNEAARVWISGLETVKRKLGISLVYDLSATPFFLRGSGYAEGTLFPWTVSDFSLMDAIECGIVKLPRVPVSDSVPGEDVPRFRFLWEHIRRNMPKTRRSTKRTLDPLSLPAELLTALDALYGNYAKAFALWEKASLKARQLFVPPVFIIVCNNTSTSELIYKYVSGFERENDSGVNSVEIGRLELFRNYDEFGNRLARPRTILIDSVQLESGEGLDKDFRKIASDEIERFYRERVARTGNTQTADNISDAELLREVMNTVGKPEKLGEQIRCVVSVSMLTEGWDARNVTHILGVRAFGTQLLCEQVVGRALRRQSYDLNEDGLLNVEYADVLGVPFDFTDKPVVIPPEPPNTTVWVHAVRPDRDALEITFPRVEGYRVDLPEERLEAEFKDDHILHLTPDMVGPKETRNKGILGDGVNLKLENLESEREATIIYHLTKHLLYSKFRDPGEEPRLHLFGQLKRITRKWLLGGYLKCSGGTYPAQLLYQVIADRAAEQIKAAITETLSEERPVKAILNPYNPIGTTADVNFTTSKEDRWQTDQGKCHVNWAICDQSWEAGFCRVVEDHPRVLSYVKNFNLGLEVPYLLEMVPKRYIPDFIVRVDDGGESPLNLIVEIKGWRGEDAKHKANAMKAYWVPGVNNLGSFGRWWFAEFTDANEMEADFSKLIDNLTAKEVT